MSEYAYGSQDLTQTQTQDGDWFDSQQPQTCEEAKPWGRIIPRKIVFKRLGNQSVTIQESLSASFGKSNWIFF